MPLEGWDYLEFWVGNATQAAYFYEHAYGFTPVAYAGPETGVRDRASYVLEQGDIRFVITSGLRGDGENMHSFVNRSDYGGPHLPGYVSIESNGDREGVGLRVVDHVVGNVELGRMNYWVDYYERALGFTELIHFSDEAIHTEYSALMSKVMTDGEGKIKFPINEPAEGKRKSQIEEYLDYYGSPGVQHVAMQTEDIVATVEALKERGIRFLETPEAYYDEVADRVGEIGEDYDDLRRLGILADRDEEGYLLQIFTRTAQDRPTLFFEVIERHGARGFGEGNFKALFESIEREQALRGNL